MQTDFLESRGMAMSARRAPALPAPHLPRGSNARSQKFESASLPSSRPHDEKDARPIGTRLLVLAWQLQEYRCAIRAIFAKAIRDCLATTFASRRPALYARAILRYICKRIPS